MAQKVVLALCVGLVISIGIWFLFLRGDERFPVDRPQAGENIIAFGDSLVEGVGSSPGNDMVSLVAQQIGRPIINAGKSGDTTASALGRIEQDVLSKNPRVVIILLGGNDALSNVPEENTFANLQTMVEQVHATGAAVLLVGIQGGRFTDPYQKRFERLARESRASHVPRILEGILGNGEFMADPIHPNDKGYAKMADRIGPVLQEMLQ